MTTGMTMPAASLVAALNSLQKPMMFTPCWPSAGPTGGAGFACPPGICNLICPVTFFAINLFLYFTISILRITVHSSGFFHLPIFQFHRGIAPENIDGHFQLPALRLDLLDHSAEIQERPIVYLH